MIWNSRSSSPNKGGGWQGSVLVLTVGHILEGLAMGLATAAQPTE